MSDNSRTVTDQAKAKLAKLHDNERTRLLISFLQSLGVTLGTASAVALAGGMGQPEFFERADLLAWFALGSGLLAAVFVSGAFYFVGRLTQ